MQTTIKKWGNSQGIRIPKAFLESLGMKENDNVEIERVDDSIVIKKIITSQKLTLNDIFDGYTENYQPKEFDWGNPVGKEVW